MFKLFQNKKLTAILCVVLAVVLVASSILVVWQLTKDDGPYTVSFVTNGGNEIEAFEVEKGTVLSQADLPVPSKRGDMFLAWYTDEALTNPYWDAPVESDMTLYASYVQPVDDATVTELVESVIPFASTDFSVTVCSSAELTNENVWQYIMLTFNYGQHENGDAIKLSVTSEGNDVYRISGNFAAGGEYILTLMSDEVTFNPEDEMLISYGLTDALRILRFRIIGDAYMEGDLSDKVADIPTESIVKKDNDSITVLGGNQNLIGATEEDNGIIKVGESDDISNYYKVLAVEATDANGITYTVRPAEVDEVYDHVIGYEWKDFDPDDFVLSEEIKNELIADLEGNEELNNYVKYLATAATYTPTYQTLVAQQIGQVEVIPLENTLVTPVGVTVGMGKAYNEHFLHVIGAEKSENFIKLTLGIKYQVKIAKVGGVGSITAEVGLQVDFWVWLGAGGLFELGWFEYDIDYGTTILTQTEITFTIGLMTDDAKKAVNINDEIEAIYNSAKDPSPENLLEQYNELMGGGSKPIELFNRNIFEMPLLNLAGIVKVSVPVRFVVTLDAEASFTSYVTVLTGDMFGVVGNEDTGLDATHVSMDERCLYRMELRGHIELKTGFEAGIELSLFFDLGKVSMNVQAGVYAEIYGYFFYEMNGMNGIGGINKGGAYYFEFGAYLDVILRAEVCKIKYSGSLWDKKWPLYTAGQKEILYGFVNPTGDVIDLQGITFVNIEDTGILDVYVYDITEERSKDNPRIVENYPYDKYKFDISFSDGFNMNFDCIAVSNPNEGAVFEGTMMINYTGAQLSFRDTLTKYVTVRYSRDENMSWDNVGKTFNIDFTIDGEVIFSREYPYGSTICFEPSGGNSYYLNTHIDHYMYNGKLITDLRGGEQEALYNAGYAAASWPIMAKSETHPLGDLIYVTEDMTIEAESNVKRRPWKVTITENGWAEVIEVAHGEEITLPAPSETKIITGEYVYDFVGWKAEDGTIFSIREPHTITSDLILTPQYWSTGRYYSVTFDANGGLIGDRATFTTQFEYGEAPESPATPTREATANARYEFIGWSPEISAVTGDITYTAQWREIKRYTVTFDAGDGQFDESGRKTVTITVDEGYAVSASDIPTDPYLKAAGGYYGFEAWSAAVSAGAVIKGNVTYTATYKDKLTRTTGILISDGINTEDIASFLDGTNKVKGYTYTLNTEFYGNSLVITAPGLTVSGEASNIHITVSNTEVTLHNLTLTQTERIEVILAEGKATVSISGNVRLTANTDAEVIRGDNSGEWDPVNGGYTNDVDADITLRGVSSDSRLTVIGQGYGIAVYGALTVQSLDVNINMPTAFMKDPETGMVYGAVALQVHNHPKGILTVNDSDIVINGGVVNAAWLNMTNSHLTFTAEEFVPGYSDGLFIMNYSAMTDREALIVLKNSHIVFTHDIAIAFAVSLEDGTEYYVNTSLEKAEIPATYPSLDALLADVAVKGYSGMVEIDGNSSIE